MWKMFWKIFLNIKHMTQRPLLSELLNRFQSMRSYTPFPISKKNNFIKMNEYFSNTLLNFFSSTRSKTLVAESEFQILSLIQQTLSLSITVLVCYLKWRIYLQQIFNSYTSVIYALKIKIYLKNIIMFIFTLYN